MKPILALWRRHTRRAAIFTVVVGLILLALAGCKDFSFFNELGVKGGLTIAPASVSILAGGTMSFNAYGGNGDYEFSIISSHGGIIDPASGVYTAPCSACSEVIMVTDGTGLSATATVSVVTTLDELEINPKVATLSPGGQITFVATGGNDSSYEYSFQTNNSGGTINAATGLYTAGPVTGVSDLIIVTDADLTVCAIPADVSVVAAASSVNYAVTADTFPATADAGSALSGAFTLTNLGMGNGAKPVSWWLYLSEDGTFGGDGETLIASNNSGALTAGDSAVVTPTGTWPIIGGAYTLFIMVSAEDDTTHSDNIYEKTDWPITLTVPDVDYRVTSITNTSENHVGESISGIVSLDNEGTDDGVADFTLNIYVSTNTLVDVGDTLVYSITDSGLPWSDPATDYSYSGTWPSNPDSYYLVAEVFSADDTAAGNDGNNITSIGPFTVHYREVDYYADGISGSAGMAGGTLSAGFTLNNGGTDASQTSATWNFYLSTNTDLDAGDYLAATGSEMLSGGPPDSAPITLSGATWPLTPGDYYFIVEIESSEDVAAGKTGNDIAVSAGTYNASSPDVDYTVSAVNFVSAGSTYVPDGAVNGNFEYQNNGSSSGTQAVSWEAYASLDTALDAGDVLIESGSGLSPLGGSGATSGLMPFSGSWPLDYGKYYLLVRVMSSEEGKPLDNVGASTATEAVGYFDETGANDSGDDYEFLSDFTDLGVTFKPGMSIEISGDMTSSDLDDIFGFNTGTCSMITFAVTYGPTVPSRAFIRIYVMDGPNSFIDGVLGTADAISLNWLVDTTGVQRYLDLDNRGEELTYGQYYDGTYTCVITGH
jgi:hypothetical protein